MTAYPPSPYEEPLLDVDEIQGNILPGFMKPHMTLISMMFGDMTSGRKFLATHEITSLADVLLSRRQVRAARTLQPTGFQVGAIPDGVDDVWLNVALSYQGLRKVAQHQRSVEAPADDSGNYVCALEVQVNSFDDNAFRLGLAARSAGLGDPTSPDAEGHPANWVLGADGRKTRQMYSRSSPRTTLTVWSVRLTGNVVRLSDMASQCSEKMTVRSSTTTAASTSGFRTESHSPVCGAAFLSTSSLIAGLWTPSRTDGSTVFPGSFWCGPGNSCSATPRCRPTHSCRVWSAATARRGVATVPIWSTGGCARTSGASGISIAAQARVLQGKPGFKDWDNDRLASPLHSWDAGNPGHRWLGCC